MVVEDGLLVTAVGLLMGGGGLLVGLLVASVWSDWCEADAAALMEAEVEDTAGVESGSFSTEARKPTAPVRSVCVRGEGEK